MTDIMKYKFDSAQDRMFKIETKPEDRYKNWLNALHDAIILFFIMYFNTENKGMKVFTIGLTMISLVIWIILFMRRIIILKRQKSRADA